MTEHSRGCIWYVFFVDFDIDLIFELFIYIASICLTPISKSVHIIIMKLHSRWLTHLFVIKIYYFN